MTTRRFIRTVMCVAMAVVAGLFNAAPASAETQETPSTVWTQPGGPGRVIDGVGTWVYVAPQAPAGPNQLPQSYAYSLAFSFPNQASGFMSLTTGPGGKAARLSLSTIVEVPYDWTPGRFYFLYVHHLQGGLWGGWVMDWVRGDWTYIGSVQAPAGYGLLGTSSRTRVWWPGSAGAAAGCSSYPRTDAYFFPTLGYTGAEWTIGTMGLQHVQEGDCDSQTEMLSNGWVHYRLGADPA
ncbi:MAG TPA: hypothetical protein VGV86_01175 [Acidimicrobiales bacterium]|nr:hypothetical protein [Acidimicrobiales bacterium]